MITNKYIHRFTTLEEMESARNGFGVTYYEPWLSATDEGEVAYNNAEGYERYLELVSMPLTFEILTDGNLRFRSASLARTIEYRVNDGQWKSLEGTVSSSPNITGLTAGDTVQFRGNNSTYGKSNGYAKFDTASTQCSFNVKGNIMSLVNSTDFSGLTALTGTYNFNKFFSDTLVENAKDLILPMGVTSYCFNDMFSNCTNLKTPPSLPATALTGYCYYRMFYGCSSLRYIPTLPAEELKSNCYCQMFCGCSSITSAPAIPAKSIPYRACYEMFDGCTSLVTPPPVIGDAEGSIDQEGCSYMFNRCNLLATAPRLPITNFKGTGVYKGMFNWCLSLSDCPELPSTNLTSHCYYSMFGTCSGITETPDLPATTLTGYCYYQMFTGCTSLTRVSNLPATALTSNCYFQMFKGCTNLRYIKCLAESIPYNTCTTSWVENVSSSGTFVKSPNMSSWSSGVDGIPVGWEVDDDGIPQ